MEGNGINLEISCDVHWGTIMIEVIQFCLRIRKQQQQQQQQKNRNVLGKESQKETE